ncbi:MAG: hypothetical protein U0324_12940 [Polyangiales bacterium]
MSPFTPLRLAAPLALALAASGCPDNNGADPPADRLFFPVAAALHRPSPGAQADFLYVVNANFDLAYNGSTVTALDLERLRNRLADHAGCKADPASAGAWICNDVGLVRPEFTRKINPYAVDAALATYANGTTTVQRLYVLVRGGNTMTWFTVNSDGSLDCGTADERGYCNADHSAGSGQLPQDPSSISVDAQRGLIVVTHQSFDDNVPRASLFYDPSAPEQQAPAPRQSTAPYLVNVVAGLPPGLSGLALLPRVGNARSTWLATSRSDASFTTLQAYPGSTMDPRLFLYRAATTTVTGLNTGADSRAIALDPRDPARRAYVTSRRPEALLTLDISNPSAPTIQNVVPLPAGASRLAAVDAGDRTVVYAVSYDARRLSAVDPAGYGDNPTSATLAQVPTNRGPHAMIHDPVDKRLYVLDFLDASVEVIDVDPARPTYNRRVLTVGAPGRSNP